MPFLESLGLALPSTTRLGGHSAPRTRSNTAGPNVGAYITKALAARVAAAANVEQRLHTQVWLRSPPTDDSIHSGRLARPSLA